MKLADFGTEKSQRLSKRPMPNSVDRWEPGFASEIGTKLHMSEMEEVQNRLASFFGGRLPLRKDVEKRDFR
jgi:hypothetical protein